MRGSGHSDSARTPRIGEEGSQERRGWSPLLEERSLKQSSRSCHCCLLVFLIRFSFLLAGNQTRFLPPEVRIKVTSYWDLYIFFLAFFSRWKLEMKILLYFFIFQYEIRQIKVCIYHGIRIFCFSFSCLK